MRRVLTAKFRLGLFDNPFVDEDAAPAILAETAHRDQARSAAEQSMVLLKNDDRTLPLEAGKLTSVAVIGQLADSKRDTLGPWIFDHGTEETVTVLGGLRERLGDDARFEHAPGAGIVERVFPTPFDQMDQTVQTTPADWDDDAEIDRAPELPCPLSPRGSRPGSVVVAGGALVTTQRTRSSSSPRTCGSA
ncbi:glycoside hydrolase family 3 C-terminal domain-containing protein [Streptomyces acidicola]|uniref:glycoside hydrolase family 3 C-terminal domain-containing protein n=1 Tax=Streptomyces acidicola TaxID=2596892 RepID=UPI003437EBA0